MYLWKCWREYRRVAIGLLGLFVTLAWVGDYLTISRLRYVEFGGQRFVAGLEWPRGMSSMVRDWASQHLWSVLHDIHEVNVDLLVMAGLLAAIFVGSMGSIATEFDGKSAEVLFSKPRRRARLLWTNWFSGVLAMEVTLLLTALLSWGYCAIFLHSVTYETSYAHVRFRWTTVFLLELLRVLLAMLPVNVMVFSISIFVGVAFRGAPKGTLAATLSVGLYCGFYALLREHFGLDTPAWWFDKLFGTVMQGTLPAGLLLLWTVLPLTLPLAAQKLLERRDVA